MKVVRNVEKVFLDTQETLLSIFGRRWELYKSSRRKLGWQFTAGVKSIHALCALNVVLRFNITVRSDFRSIEMK